MPSQLLPVHRDAQLQPVQPGCPGVLREAVEPVRAAVGGGEPPPDSRAGHEVPHAFQVVTVEAEAAADRARAEQVEHLGRRQARVGELEQPRHDVQHRVDLAQGSVRESHGEAMAGVPLVARVGAARPEGGRDQRREGVDVRAQDQHVAGLQRRVVGQQAEHDLAQYLDLPMRSVTGVDAHGPVVRGEHVVPGRGMVVAQIPLESLQQRPRGVAGRGVVALVGIQSQGVEHGDQADLQLADVAAERGEQGMAGELPSGVAVSTRRGRLLGLPEVLGDPGPQRGGRVRQPHVHIAVLRERGEHGEMGRREPGGTEERQPRRQVGRVRITLECRDGRAEPLGRVRAGDARP